jgi:hypothetical protein
MKAKPKAKPAKTKTVTEKRWAYWDGKHLDLCFDRRKPTSKWLGEWETVVRVTLTAEVPR